MKPIEPAELSAYLDGELTPERAREVEAALAGTPALREELQILAHDDAAWRVAARTASFPAEVRLPHPRSFGLSAGRALLGILALLAIRFLPRLASTFTLDLALNAVGLAIITVWVVALLRDTEHPQDFRHLVSPRTGIRPVGDGWQ